MINHFHFIISHLLSLSRHMGVKGFAAWLAAEYPGAFAYGEPPPPPRRVLAAGGRGDGGGDGGGPANFVSRRSDGFATVARAGGGGSGPANLPPLPSSFDHVYVDMAGLLHTALRQGMRGGPGDVGDGSASKQRPSIHEN